MRSTIESAPKDGQRILVQDANGQECVAYWSSKLEAWFAEGGEPIVFRPLYWRPVPPEGSKELPEETVSPVATSVPPGNGTHSVPSGGQFAIVEDAVEPFKFEAWPGPDEVPIEWRPADTSGLLSQTDGPRRRPLPLLLIALISVAASAVVMATFFHAESQNDFRDLVGWLRRLDVMSTAAQPPAARHAIDIADAARAQNSIDADASLKTSDAAQAHDPIDKEVNSKASSATQAKDPVESDASLEASNVTQAKDPIETDASSRASNASQKGDPIETDAKLKSSGATQVQGPADADPSLEPPSQQSARERHASINRPDEKSEQNIDLEPGPLTHSLEQKSQDANREGVVIGEDAASRRSVSNNASETQLARTIDNVRPGPNSHALPEPPEAAKLLARASELLKRGDIGAARLVLDLAHDLGSARAAFMLAETYDPLVLLTWAAMGTRADAAKARELYAKAYAGGIAEAKGRSDALTK